MRLHENVPFPSSWAVKSQGTLPKDPKPRGLSKIPEHGAIFGHAGRRRYVAQSRSIQSRPSIAERGFKHDGKQSVEGWPHAFTFFPMEIAHLQLGLRTGCQKDRSMDDE